jgi:hypothetical protein
MELILVGLVFVLAIALPIYLLIHFGSLAWPWHVLAAMAALAIGLSPGTALLNTVSGTFLYGFAIGFLMVWGVGGLFAHRGHEKGVASKAA